MNFPQVEEQIHFRVRALLYDLQCETRGGAEADVVMGCSNPNLCREGALTMWVALQKSLGDSWDQKFGETALGRVRRKCLSEFSIIYGKRLLLTYPERIERETDTQK